MHRFLSNAARPLAVVAALCTSLLPSAFAQDWYVDVNDPQCASGDGSASHPFCAIQDAIDAAASGDTVHVAPGTYFELLQVDKDLHFLGTAGEALTIVDGSASGTLMTVGGPHDVEVRGLTLTNGKGSVAGISCATGTTLTLANSTVSNCDADFAIVFGSGALTLDHASLHHNYAYRRYSGFTIYWGGTLIAADTRIDNNTGTGIQFGGSTLTLTNCSLVDNSYGGLNTSYVADGRLDRCTLTRNSAGYGHYGAAVHHERGTLTLTNCTMNNNRATTYGSGGAVSNEGTMTLTNCTLSNNAAQYDGGAILNLGDMTLENCTITKNDAIYYEAAVENRSKGTLRMGNTIVAGNQGHDCSGTITSLGYNLVQDSSGFTFVGDTTGNLLGVDPLLGRLLDNGGPTKTHAIDPASPARDAGNPDPAKFPATDQRGVRRTACDMGAYEIGLALNADPDEVLAGQTVDLRTFDGLPGSPAFLFVVQIDGSPYVQRLASGVLDASGTWLLSSIVPPGLEGTDLLLLGFAYATTGKFTTTNLESLFLR